MKLLLFDLDGTLLRDDKTISRRTLHALQQCREQGILIGICTSRAEHNCRTFMPELQPDLLIASGGAVVKFRDEYIYTAEFTPAQTRHMIAAAREICGADCEITLDTLEEHYWNYKVDPNLDDATWGETIYTDYADFAGKALKICVQIFEEAQAAALAECLDMCDCLRFTGSYWHKFTKKEATKENALRRACEICGIRLEDITAFGDDTPDIGMLTLCGTGVAMGNAVEGVKKAADVVIGSNEADGIAVYLENCML